MKIQILFYTLYAGIQHRFKIYSGEDEVIIEKKFNAGFFKGAQYAAKE